MNRLEKSKMLRQLSWLLLGTAAVVAVVGCFVAWGQYRENSRSEKVAAEQQVRANHGHATGDNPSTVKPPAGAFDTYKVAGDLPRSIRIPKIKVKAVVKQVGLTRAGAIGAPSNVYDAAWYTGSAKPGHAGATLIDGHVSSWTTNGVFYDLKQLKAGDKITIERGDGTVVEYTVVERQTYPAEKVDMHKVMTPINPNKPGLNLITCAGDVIKGSNEFSQRTVVFAEKS